MIDEVAAMRAWWRRRPSLSRASARVRGAPPRCCCSACSIELARKVETQRTDTVRRAPSRHTSVEPTTRGVIARMRCMAAVAVVGNCGRGAFGEREARGTRHEARGRA